MKPSLMFTALVAMSAVAATAWANPPSLPVAATIQSPVVPIMPIIPDPLPGPVLSGAYIATIVTTCPPVSRNIIEPPLAFPPTAWIDTFSGTATFAPAARTVTLSGVDDVATFLSNSSSSATYENQTSQVLTYYNDSLSISVGPVSYHVAYGALVKGIPASLVFSGLNTDQCTVAGRLTR